MSPVEDWFAQSPLGRVLRAAAVTLPLAAAVYVASGSAALGVSIAALDLVLRPALRRLSRRAILQRWNARR